MCALISLQDYRNDQHNRFPGPLEPATGSFRSHVRNDGRRERRLDLMMVCSAKEVRHVDFVSLLQTDLERQKNKMTYFRSPPSLLMPFPRRSIC